MRESWISQTINAGQPGWIQWWDSGPRKALYPDPTGIPGFYKSISADGSPDSLLSKQRFGFSGGPPVIQVPAGNTQQDFP